MKQKDMSEPTQRWRVEVISTDDGERIDRLLSRRLRFLSRSQLQRVLERGRVQLFDDWQQRSKPKTVQRASARVRTGQLVLVELDSLFMQEASPEDLDTVGSDNRAPATLPSEQILFSDDHLIIVNKSSGCAVQPSKWHPRNSLIEQLHRFQAARGDEAPATPCHRLDRETSGVVVFARTARARTTMGELFEQRAAALSKVYVAVVTGCLNPPQGTIELPIVPDDSSSIPFRQWVPRQGNASQWERGQRPGKQSKTTYRTLRVGHSSRRSLLELLPATGRRHQLRVHLAAIGHPILGDALYSGDDALFLRSLQPDSHANGLTQADRVLLGSERLALHALELSFPHPVSGTPTVIKAPIPSMFERWLL